MIRWLVTAEHAGRDIPAEVATCFAHDSDVLDTHEAYDAGTLDMAKALGAVADACFINTTSRLVVEANRSLHHPKLFSRFTKTLPREKRQQLIQAYYMPHRHRVEHWIKQQVAAGYTVYHAGIHSFTPVWNEEIRNADIGLLYDPASASESTWASHLINHLRHLNPALVYRRNYPYLGKADGFTTYLRKRFPNSYAGIELEVNQRYAQTPNSFTTEMSNLLLVSWQEVQKRYFGSRY